MEEKDLMTSETTEENNVVSEESNEKKDNFAPAKGKELVVIVLKEILSWIEIMAVAVLIALFITKVVIINATVPTSSMVSLIDPGDRLFGYRLAYKFKEPERFDVIIFKYPVNEEENFIKRLIGLPGETVDIKEGKIYINGSDVPLVENYLPNKWYESNDGFHFEVPEDCYLMLGDNRNVSLDARFWAEEAYDLGLVESVEAGESYTFVKKEQILGKAVIKYWPKIKLLSTYEANEN